MRLLPTTLSAAVVVALFAGAPPLSAQSGEAVIVVDVMVVNDDGGTLDGTTVAFEHPALGGGTTSGSDGNVDQKCLTTDGGSCYIATIPAESGEITVTPVDGYTITVDCSIENVLFVTAAAGTATDDLSGESIEAATALGTASGSTWTADPNDEVFCTVMLDDDPGTPSTTVPPTTSTTTTTTTTTTIAATTTTVAPTTAAPTTPPPPPVPAPDTVLPETGPSHNAWIAAVGALLLALGAGTIRLARR